MNCPQASSISLSAMPGSSRKDDDDVELPTNEVFGSTLCGSSCLDDLVLDERLFSWKDKAAMHDKRACSLCCVDNTGLSPHDGLRKS